MAATDPAPNLLDADPRLTSPVTTAGGVHGVHGPSER